MRTPATIRSTASLSCTRTVLSERDKISAISRDERHSCRLSRNTVRQRSGRLLTRRPINSSNSDSIRWLSEASPSRGGGIPVEYRDGNLFERKTAATCPAFPQITVRFVSGNDVEISIDIAYPPKRNAGLPDRNENIAHDLAASLLVPQEIVSEPKNALVI